MHKPEVSIIIPCYKGLKTIERCLDSILKQVTKYKYEIILVEDYLEDKNDSVERIINENYKDFVKFYKASNRLGPGGARNFGIKQALSEYLLFVDCDDYVSMHFVEKMISTAKNYQSDIVICNFKRVNEQGKETDINKGSFKIYDQDKSEVLLMEFHSCNKLITKKLMEKYPYPENMLYEDVVSISRVILNSTKIVKIPDYLYYYVFTMDSTTRTLEPKRNLDILKAYEIIKDDYIKYPLIYQYLCIEVQLIDLYIKLIRYSKSPYISSDIAKKYYTLAQNMVFKFKKANPEWYKNPYLKRNNIKKKIFLILHKYNLYSLIEKLV